MALIKNFILPKEENYGFIKTVEIKGYETETITPPENMTYFSKIIRVKNLSMEKGVVKLLDINDTEWEIDINDISTVENLNLSGKYKSITFCNDEGSLCNVLLIAETSK